MLSRIIAYLLLILSLLPSQFAFASPAFHANVEAKISKSGLKLWVIEDHYLPIISVKLAFRNAGTAYDPVGKEGLAMMVSGLLNEGAGNYDALAFKQALQHKAIRFNVEVDENVFYVSIKTLSKHLGEALSLLSLALTKPNFSDDAIERVRNQLHVQITKRLDTPSAIADDAFRKAIFGSHAYAKPHYGTLESIQHITRDDLLSYIKRSFTREHLLISAVGDFKSKQFLKQLDTYFSDIPASGSKTITLEDVAVPTKGSTISIDRDIPQAVALFGVKAVKRNHPDFYAAYLLNFILGGGSFESRLMQEVREARGLAYSVYTRLDTYPHAGLLRGYVGTQKDKVQQSLDVIRNEFIKLRDEGITEEELHHAKRYLLGSFPLRLDKNEKLAGFLLGMQLEELPIDFLEKRSEYINAVTLDDVSKMAEEVLRPDTLITVIVGQDGQN